MVILLNVTLGIFSFVGSLWMTMFGCLLLLLFPLMTSGSDFCSESWPEDDGLIDSLILNNYTGLADVTVEFVTLDAADFDITSVTFSLEYRRSGEETIPMQARESVAASSTSSSKESLTIPDLWPNTEYDLWLVLRRDECYPDECYCTLASSSKITVKTDALIWISDSGREYFFSSDASYKLNLSAANSFCRDQDDAMLISISDETQITFITDKLSHDELCWLGLRFPHDVDPDICRSCADCADTESGTIDCDHCDSCKNHWYWIDGQQSDFEHKWGSVEPKGGNTCAVVAKTGFWLDKSCTEEHYFVCYRAAVSTMTTTSPLLTDWQIATIVVSGTLGLLLLCFLVLLGCFCKIKTVMKQKVFPGGNGVYQTADGKADLTVSF